QNGYEEYVNMVRQALNGLPYSINLVTPADARSIIEGADVIMVGGGNTFKLLHDIYDLDLFDIIQRKVKAGTPYIGWSAGSNLCGKTISTTNDMPIIQPRSFKAFGFFPFQVNPHYINQKLEGHNGETRDQRLEEFLALHPDSSIVGLPEGTALKLDNGVVQFVGDTEGVLFSRTSTLSNVKNLLKPGTTLSHVL
ncbi:MAG: dipeptidase PepE, partial [Flavisolibacter sp.]